MFKKPTNKKELLDALKAANFEVVAIQSGDSTPVGEYVKRLPWRDVTVIVLRAK